MRLFKNPLIVGSLAVSALLVAPVVAQAPVVAHEVETAGNVAALFHIEPGHHPKAGVPSKAWFALTRRGGQIISLAQCNCQLAVYAMPRSGKTPPVLRPALGALTVERYKGVPGATIVFPKAGMYELELSGNPKAGANFQPFRFSYKVTVSG